MAEPSWSSLEQVLDLAISRHLQGALDEAEAIYRSVLAEFPEQPTALHFLGMLLHQRPADGGNPDQAVDLLRRSIALCPDRAEWHNDLGNVLSAQGHTAQAAAAFQHALALAPDHAITWNNLGATLERLDQAEAAEAAYRQAIAHDPECIDALYNLGNLLVTHGRKLEGADYQCRAYVLGPMENKPKSMLGIAYYKLGRIAEAAECYRLWMQEEPDNPQAAHLYASCSGLAPPPRASAAYVETTFDKYASRFDEQLHNLSYQGPQLIASALAELTAPAGNLACLDAGCGTGLCGVLIKPFASRLVGIDLSSRMLSLADKRGLYDALVHGELTEYLAGQQAAFDLIISGDTINYFGALEPLFAAAHSALKAKGWFLFTVEEGAEDTLAAGYRLHPHGRYTHDQAYLKTSLTDTGFKLLELKPAVLRVELGVPVSAWVVVAAKGH